MSGLAEYVHLRVHTAYSLSEGAVRAKDLAALCDEYDMPAVAVTDTNNLFGAMEFSGALAGAGVQPIIGCQLTVRLVDTETEKQSDEFVSGNIVLLAQDRDGYGNILKLLRRAYLESDDAHDPHVSLDDLTDANANMIALSGGPNGPVGAILQRQGRRPAEALTRRLAEIYDGRFYIEIMRHGQREEAETEPDFLDFAERLDLPLVATNEVFFPSDDMYEAHDALLCIAQGRHVSESDRRRLTPHHRFKSAAEMREVFADLPEAVDNTLVIARRCAFMVEKIDPILPPFDAGNGLSEEDELRRQAAEGLELRLAADVWTDDMDTTRREEVAREYRDRLAHELDVIVNMGFPGYFLIVADFIQWAKERDIPVGPGRGSGAGSVVAWALTITDLDPLRWGLLFERFLNPERVSMPDFDIDFCQDRRDEVINYVQRKYGRDKVAQIITFGKLQARAALRDVGRVLSMPYGQVDRICKLVPNNPANPVSLSDAIAGEPELREQMDQDPDVARMMKIALKLEGLYRHASTHAAGVVIGDRPLDELIPLYRDPRSEMPVTGFSMKYVESAGLVKFDFLGLKTLTVLSTAERLVRERGGALEVARIPLDDAKTFEMIGRGETTGVFQLESAGMRDVLRGLRPEHFEVIIAVVALYRPGPMDNIPSYIRRMHGEEEIDYLYPSLQGILEETFGIIIYQEQVMQIAQELAGYSLGAADLLRRAMGKKIASEMDEQRAIFVSGSVERGVPEKRAAEIFDLVAKFAGYGFNKSHAAAYALVAYHTAYMKANHPVEFFAASMTLDMGNTDKLNGFRQELDRLGIPLLQPDINRSRAEFSVDTDPEGNPGIRYALGAIKNVGTAAMEALVREREENGPFADLADFVSRVDPHQMNKRLLENLIRAGVFDSLGYNRRQLFVAAEQIMRHAVAAQNDRATDQMGLFAGEAAPKPEIRIDNGADWSPLERLKEEFDAIGFYLSSHPLDGYGSQLDKLRVRYSAEVLESRDTTVCNMAGTVIGKKERTSAKGNRYAFVQLSDPQGAYEVIVFSDVLSQARELLDVGRSVFLKVSAQVDGDSVRLSAQSVEPIEQRANAVALGLRIVVADETPLAPLREILERQGDGRSRVQIVTRLREEGRDEDVFVDIGDKFAVNHEVLLAARAVHGVLEVQEI
ncbi:MAG: DNA polymerase III subunit alpha [Rhodospirillales bacterium]